MTSSVWPLADASLSGDAPRRFGQLFTIDHVADPARNTVDRVSSAAHETVDKLASEASHVADRFSDQARWVSEAPHRALDCSKSWVQERPLEAVGAALALGFIVGRLTAR